MTSCKVLPVGYAPRGTLNLAKNKRALIGLTLAILPLFALSGWLFLRLALLVRSDQATRSDLITQRYRWKWGRLQTFLKNKSMFLSRERKFTRGLVWIVLPFALFFELTFLLEPVIVSFILYIVVAYRDYLTLASALAIISFYVSMNILADETIPRREKLQLVMLTPLMYFAFYIVSFAEYVALIKALVNLRKLKSSLAKNRQTWIPVERLGQVHSPARPSRPSDSAERATP